MKGKEQLQCHKTVKVCGSKFTIRKINPILDFEATDMPQIFTSFISMRNTDKSPYDNTAIMRQMMRVVSAGLVTPELVSIGAGEKRGREAGITVEDIFRDEECGVKLFQEIMFHSLNKYKGLKGVFFSLKTKLKYYTALAKLTASVPAR